MAHEIEYNKSKGTHSFFSRKEIPWHRLGQIVDEAQTSEQALKLANLDFDVLKVPNYAYDKERGIFVRNNESFSTIRQDNLEVLGTVGSKYEVLQNTEAFKFFDDIVGSKQAIFETAGVLYNGKKVFMTAKLPDYIRFSNDDPIEQYLLLTNDHTGAESTIITFTPVRVVCNNTMIMALNSARNLYRIRHTKSLQDRMKEVVTMMGIKNKYFEELSIAMNAMKDIKVTQGDVKNHVLNLVLNNSELEALSKSKSLVSTDEISKRKKNVIYDMFSWIEEGVGQNMYVGTGLWMYNGVNGYFNNGKTYRSDENRMENLINGTANTIINKSKNLILHG